jgi:hypothetical protein
MFLKNVVLNEIYSKIYTPTKVKHHLLLFFIDWVSNYQITLSIIISSQYYAICRHLTKNIWWCLTFVGVYILLYISFKTTFFKKDILTLKFAFTVKQSIMCKTSSLPEQFSYTTLHTVNKPSKFISREIFYIKDNARPHRARIVNQYKQQEAIDTIPWPAMSPDMNPIEHVWDCIG